ncbi:MAG: tyrosine-protein phosphatase [Eubacteriales bacterium]|nr:tyrosine-protein phosphatase [Eubacteriales bacterium]
MKYGKIRIEDGYLVFTKHMMMNSLPCKDIMWAYMRREGMDSDARKQLIVNYLVIVTRRKKRYKFDMTEREVHDCIRLLKVLNPEMAVGFPKGGRLPLQSLPNTRDLGALMTEDGRHILPRRLLRSGELYHVSLADQETLKEEYKLKKVIDLRTSAERTGKPDTVMPGVEYYRLPILDEETVGISHEGGLTEMLMNFSGNAEAYMEKQYESLIRDKYSVKQYARFLDILLHHGDGAVLWHCSAGKDRVGVGTILLLCVLGVPREIIREDFLRTNMYLETELQYMIRMLEARMDLTAEMAENISIMFHVKETYFDAVFRAIDQDYGSVDRFLRKALYLTPKAIEDMQEKYLI